MCCTLQSVDCCQDQRVNILYRCVGNKTFCTIPDEYNRSLKVLASVLVVSFTCKLKSPQIRSGLFNVASPSKYDENSVKNWPVEVPYFFLGGGR